MPLQPGVLLVKELRRPEGSLVPSFIQLIPGGHKGSHKKARIGLGLCALVQCLIPSLRMQRQTSPGKGAQSQKKKKEQERLGSGPGQEHLLSVTGSIPLTPAPQCSCFTPCLGPVLLWLSCRSRRWLQGPGTSFIFLPCHAHNSFGHTLPRPH